VAEEGVVIGHLVAEARRTVRHISNVAGVRQLYTFLFAHLEKGAQKRRHGSRNDSTGDMGNG